MPCSRGCCNARSERGTPVKTAICGGPQNRTRRKCKRLRHRARDRATRAATHGRAKKLSRRARGVLHVEPVRAVRSVVGGVAVAIALLIAVRAAAQTPAGSQTPTPSTPVPVTQTRPAQDVRPGTVPPSDIPGVLLPPPTGPDFLYAPPARGPLTLTPSLAITEQYNDNIFSNNRDKQSDFITQFTPGVALQIQHPGFQLLS